MTPDGFAIRGLETKSRDYIGEPAGLTMFLDEAKGGQVWSL